MGNDSHKVRHSAVPSRDFGSYIKHLRMGTGLTIAEVSVAVSRLLNSSIARTTINGIENNKVNNIKPDVMRALASVLDEKYHNIVTQWTAYAYNLKGENIVKMFDDSGIVLRLSDEWFEGLEKKSNHSMGMDQKKRNIKPNHQIRTRSVESLPSELQIISLAEFREIQGALPAGSRVFVAATDFLDDDVFYDMVVNNFKKPIKYFYYIERYELYKRFLNRVIKDGWDEKAYGSLDGNITHFLETSVVSYDVSGMHRDVHFPINCVLLDDIETLPQAYVGLIVRDRPAYYQIADIGLTYRIKALFQALQIRSPIKEP